MKRIALFALLITVVAAAAQTTPPGAQTFVGSTEPSAKVEVPAPMRGQIMEIAVKEGQPIKKDQPIARLDDAIQKQTVELARLEADSKAEIQLAESQRDFAKNEFERFSKNQSATPYEIRQKELNFRQAEIILEQKKEQALARQVVLQRERITLDHMTIKSPIDGTVLRINKQAGEATEENLPLAVVVQTTKLNAYFYLPKPMFGRVKAGDKVTIRLATEPPLDRQATVTVVDPTIDPAGQLFRVKLELDNSDAKVPAGTGATWVIP